jgi:V-type H+-transporting ATPase subunit E
MHSLLTAASEKLAAFAQPQSAPYKALLAELIAQAVTTLEGAPVTVRCRQVDLAAVQEAAGKAKSKLGKEAPSIAVDAAAFLAPPPNPAAPDAAACLGGVVVATLDGRIKVSNTLEERLRGAYDHCLPSLRTAIFGKNASLRA